MQEEGNLEAAIECYEMALSIDVHYAKSSLLLGVLYRQRGGPHDLTLGQVGFAGSQQAPSARLSVSLQRIPWLSTAPKTISLSKKSWCSQQFSRD